MLWLEGGSTKHKKIPFLRVLVTDDGFRIAIPPGFSVHHRKPQRYGGKTTKANISIVLRMEHDAWNLLFDNHDTLKVAELLNGYWKILGSNEFWRSARQEATFLIRKALKKKKRTNLFNAAWLRRIERLGVQCSVSKKFMAWVLLFDNLSFGRIVNKINKVWIDPDRELMIRTISETIQSQKVFITTRAKEVQYKKRRD